jgi:hypothetical protein
MLVFRHLLVVVLSGALAFGCGDPSPPSADASRLDALNDATSDAPVIPCSADDDLDHDGISNRFEGLGDTDHDDVPDARDVDSDDDGIPDAFEASAGRPRGCLVAPVDSDSDGIPDFQDVDSNGDTLPDALEASPSAAQRVPTPPARDCLDASAPGVRPSVVTAWTCHPWDTDADGTPDYADTDIDDDRIQNPLEIMPGGASSPTDTDRDGLPDYRDPDADDDTIGDVHEGAMDRDGDGVANFRDRDSDDDSPPSSTANVDAREAGDTDLRTPPIECPNEIDARTLDPASRRLDGVPDYLDTDSDNDGLSDDDEVLAETNRCDADSDDDGILDSLEVAWCRANGRAHCATDIAVRIPESETWVALPYMGPATQRELAFNTVARVADVFFLIDTSSRNAPALAALQTALSVVGRGALDAARTLAPDAQLGVAHFEDFDASPTTGAPYGLPGDRALWPLCAGAPGTMGCRPGWGITLQPASRAGDVLAAAQALSPGGGGDAPGSQIEALYQVLAGDGLYTGDAATACENAPGRAPCWITPRRCPDGTRGQACFRRGALPVVLLLTASDFHGGPPGMAGGAPWAPYEGLMPRPHTFAELANEFATTGARVIGVNGNPTARCETSRLTRIAGDPCFDLLAVARASGSVDRTGRPLVYDLPRLATPAAVGDLVGAALTSLANDVPFDTTLSVRADPTNPAMIDATRFVRARTPTCQLGGAPDRCWTPPPGVTASAAVARTDMNGFYRVVPGTRVRFTVSLRNDTVYEGAAGLSVFKLYFDALGDGSLRDTREVVVVVPAHQRGP